MEWSFGIREAKGAPVRCNWCRAPVAIQSAGVLKPTAVELHTLGAVLVKRLGWFCGRPCIRSYETRFRVILEPEALEGAETRTA